MAESHLVEGMITDTVPQDLNIKEGAKIIMDKFRGRNIRLAAPAQQLSYFLAFLLETPGGNTSGSHTPDEARALSRGWGSFKEQWAHALKHKDFPAGNKEYSIPVMIPSIDDIKNQVNMPFLSLALEAYHIAKLMLDGMNASMHGGFIPVDSEEAIGKMILSMDDMMARHIGSGDRIDGTDASNPQFDLGSLRAPNYDILGQIRPGVGAGEAMHLEPSKDVVPGSSPDAPDRENPRR